MGTSLCASAPPVSRFLRTHSVWPGRAIRAAESSGSKTERGWTAQTTVNYMGAYRDPGSVPARKVHSWPTVDVNIGQRVDGGSRWFANAQTNLRIINVFDQRPPFLNQFDLTRVTFGYDRPMPRCLGGG